LKKTVDNEMDFGLPRNSWDGAYFYPEIPQLLKIFRLLPSSKPTK
jgi:hypothetical protein